MRRCGEEKTRGPITLRRERRERRARIPSKSQIPERKTSVGKYHVSPETQLGDIRSSNRTRTSTDTWDGLLGTIRYPMF